MGNDAGEGQRIRKVFQVLAVVCGGFVGSAAAKQELLPDDVQWVCDGSTVPATCYDTGHAGDARHLLQCTDMRDISATGHGLGTIVLRDPAYTETHVVLHYADRTLLAAGGPDGRPALVLWQVAEPAGRMFGDGFEPCREYMR